MTLGEKQRLFSKLVAKLIQHIYDSGYEVTFGEAYRTPEQAAIYAQQGKGIRNSAHTKRLAIDLNLFKDGTYLTDSESHQPFGEFWKQLNEQCCWGGDFKPQADGNHYSIIHEGIK